MKTCDSLIISIDYDNIAQTGVLLVGRKAMNKDVEIVNMFQGKEAKDLYKKLITKQGE